MKRARTVLLLTTALAGCAGDFDTSARFLCTTNSDCLSEFRCRPDVKQGKDAKPVCLPADRFSIEEDGIAIDRDLGLYWTREPLGIPMQSAPGTPCDTLDLQGKTWRFPTIDELRTLIVGCLETEIQGVCDVTAACKQSVAVPPCHVPDQCDGCPGTAGGCYWAANVWTSGCDGSIASGTIDPDTNRPWGVRFQTASVKYLQPDKDKPMRAVCVADLDPNAR